MTALDIARRHEQEREDALFLHDCDEEQCDGFCHYHSGAFNAATKIRCDIEREAQHDGTYGYGRGYFHGFTVGVVGLSAILLVVLWITS